MRIGDDRHTVTLQAKVIPPDLNPSMRQLGRMEGRRDSLAKEWKE
jgi:hypothetical protein